MATLQSNALTTLARAKDFLGLTSDRYDTVLTMLINHVSGFIETYLKRTLKETAYTNEEYDGPGTDTIVLKHFPVTALSSLQERDTDEPDVENWTTIDDKEYYWYEDGRIQKRAGTWPHRPLGNWLDTPQRYRVTYTAGYKINFSQEANAAAHTLPMEIEYACLKLVSAIFNTRKAEGFDQERIGDSAVKLKATIFEDKETRAILDKYTKPTI